MLLLVFNSPSRGRLEVRGDHLLTRCGILSHQLSSTLKMLRSMRRHSSGLCHIVLRTSPISPTVHGTKCNNAGHCRRLVSLMGSGLMIGAARGLSLLAGRLCVRSGSFSSMITVYGGRSRVLEYVPTVRPVSGGSLGGATSKCKAHVSPVCNATGFRTNVSFSTGPKASICTAKSKIIIGVN